MSDFSSQFTSYSIPNLGLVRFPEIKISPEERAAIGVSPKTSNIDILRHLAWTGYKERLAKGWFKGVPESEIIDRFRIEFTTFAKTGVTDYLLLVWDINKWCDQQGIVRGRGRGSSGGSLTLACIGVVNIDPLLHKLDFPRFISEARMKPVIKDGVVYVDGKSAPDIDCDYQYARRDEVVKYIEQKYPGHVCKISTRLELTGKTALKDTMKVYCGYSEEDARRISDMVEARFGKVQGLHEAREQNPDLVKWLEESPAHKDAYEVAMAIEGLAIAKGKHPSGVFISYEPLDGNIPVELSKDKEMVTSYDMNTVAGLGVKVDELGLRTCDLVANTAKLVGIDLDSIDVNDPSIYQYLATRDTFAGLFQIEDGLTKEATQKIKPRNVDELAATLAISRPGAMSYIGQFAEYIKTGTIKPFYPPIDEILKPTGGALIMQEQITEICREVFGLSPINSDAVRYCIGKKVKPEMAKWEPVLYENGRARNIPEDVIKSFWDTCNASADYSYCKSHALFYAYLCATTVYLKAHYPQAFYLNMLKLAREEPNALEYMQGVIKEMNLVGIKVLPPDILHSDSDFSIEEDTSVTPPVQHIRFGLSHIRGISDVVMGKLTKFRRTFSTKFEVFDAARAEGVDIRVLCSLIYSGCLQWKGAPRTRLALEAQTYNLLSDNQKKRVKQFAPEFNEDIVEILRALPTKLNEKGKPIFPESQLATIRRNHLPYWEMFLSNSRNELLCAYILERHFLGFSYSSTLHQIYSARIANLITIEQLKKQAQVIAKLLPPVKGVKPERSPQFQLVGFVGDFRETRSQRTGEPLAKGQLIDDTGSFSWILYGEEKVQSCKAFNGRFPEDGDIILVKGSLSREGTMFFANSIIIQPNPIQTKHSKTP